MYSSKFMHSKQHLGDPIAWYRLSYDDQLNDKIKPKNTENNLRKKKRRARRK